ncbi:helix-turn-helix domain-containing protein, partial [Acholeplasma vituli]
MNKAFKFRIYPTESQKTLIHMTLGHNRFLWNKMLEDKQKHYELNKTHLYNRPAQYKDTYPFLKDIDS